LMFSI